MEILSSLPDRPLEKRELDQIGQHEQVRVMIPLFGAGVSSHSIEEDLVGQFALLTGEYAHVLSFGGPDDDAWVSLGKVVADHPDMMDEVDTLAREYREEKNDAIREALG